MKLQPLFYGAHALNSFRSSGLTLTSALSELIDNSIQANAANINIELVFNPSGVSEILCSDDGNGMNYVTLSHFLTIGRSSNYHAKSGISKFGIGAKAAGLTFALQIDAYSRESTSQPFFHVGLNLNELMKNELASDQQVGIRPPSLSKEIFLNTSYYTKVSTVIRWTQIDKLNLGQQYTTEDKLVSSLSLELSRVFRFYIERGVNITLNSKSLIAFDPLYKIENSFQNAFLSKCYQNNRTYPSISLANNIVFFDHDGNKASLSVVLYPREVTRRSGLGGDKLAKALNVPNNLGKISFLRSEREIAYTTISQIFGRSVQSEDRFIGISVSFEPSLDDYFNVRNVKKGCELVESVKKPLKDKLTIFVQQARDLLKIHWANFNKSLPPSDFYFSNVESNDHSIQTSSSYPTLDSVQQSSDPFNLDATKVRHFGFKKLPQNVIGTRKNNFTNSSKRSSYCLSVNSNIYRNIYEPLLELKSKADTNDDKAKFDSALAHLNEFMIDNCDHLFLELNDE